MIKPITQKTVMTRKPSALPQRSITLAMGMNTAPEMADATMVMTVNNE
jgi:hypothetical protein